VLLRETYRGVWKFSVTERKFLSSKDYVRLVPREAPLDEATFENLRIVSDAVWFVRLSGNGPRRMLQNGGSIEPTPKRGRVDAKDAMMPLKQPLHPTAEAVSVCRVQRAGGFKPRVR
jgi:hypothetical protein